MRKNRRRKINRMITNLLVVGLALLTEIDVKKRLLDKSSKVMNNSCILSCMNIIYLSSNRRIILIQLICVAAAVLSTYRNSTAKSYGRFLERSYGWLGQVGVFSRKYGGKLSISWKFKKNIKKNSRKSRFFPGTRNFPKFDVNSFFTLFENSANTQNIANFVRIYSIFSILVIQSE